MLDIYREREIQGCRCTVMDDHVRVEYPGGWVWEEYFTGNTSGHGPLHLSGTVMVKRLPPGTPWWRRLWPMSKSVKK